jgi:hypothetical protein
LGISRPYRAAEQAGGAGALRALALPPRRPTLRRSGSGGWRATADGLQALYRDFDLYPDLCGILLA